MSKFKNIGSWGTSANAVSEENSPTKLIEGRLDRIRWGRKQYRSYTEESHIQQIMASIQEHGFSGSLPVIRVEDPQHDYEYLGGHTTGEALKRLGYKTALLSVESIDSPLKLAEFSYQLNGASRPLNAIDDSNAVLDILCEALLAQGEVVNLDELSALIRQIARGTSKVDEHRVNCIKETWERNQFEISIQSFASSRLPLLQLSETLQNSIKQGMSPASALEISKIEDEAVKAELIEKAKGMSVAEIKNAVKDTKNKETLLPSPLSKNEHEEWTPIKAFQEATRKVKKIDFEAIPKRKRSSLERAIGRVIELVEELEKNS